MRLRHLPTLQRGAIAFVPDVLLDEFDVAQHGVENVAVRVDGEMAPFEARGEGLVAGFFCAGFWARGAVVSAAGGGRVGILRASGHAGCLERVVVVVGLAWKPEDVGGGMAGVVLYSDDDLHCLDCWVLFCVWGEVTDGVHQCAAADLNVLT